MLNIIPTVIVLLLVLAPFKMRGVKYFPALLGVLVFAITFFLKSNQLLDPTKIGNLVLLVLIFACAGVLYLWYFKKVIGSRH